MEVEKIIAQLLRQKNLSEAQSRRLFTDIFKQKVNPATIKTLLLLMAKKGETAAEVSGCLKALKALEKPTRAPAPVMDTCGTGGDGKASINVSTLTAFVIAGAGVKVAKHGNRSISSQCGSSDLMEALGVKLDASKAKMLKAVRQAGLGYFHAPYYHPIFSRVQPIRRMLKTKTIFNLLGPLANPLKIKAQLVGVSGKKNFVLFANILKNMGTSRALVCHSRDGMDEVSTAAKTDIALIQKGKIKWGVIDPQKLGFKAAKPRDFIGGTVKKNKKIALQILQNKLRGSMRDLVVINAAAGLVAFGKAKDMKHGVRLAEESLNCGKAYQALVQLKRISKKA